jgi:hypothetical protein
MKFSPLPADFIVTGIRYVRPSTKSSVLTTFTCAALDTAEPDAILT